MFVSIVTSKRARWPSLFITFFIIFLTCYITVPSFIYNLCWVLLLRNHLKKWICVLSVFIAIIPTYLLCQMYTNPPEFEFQGTIYKFTKRNKLSSLLVYLLHKTGDQAFTRRSRAKTANKCRIKLDAHSIFFCLLNLLVFRRSRCRRVVESKSL